MTKSVYTIIGSGFGLYGYLPAIVRNQESNIVLPYVYKSKICARDELTHCIPRITWVKDIDSAVSKAKCVIFAIPPRQQKKLLSRYLEFPNIERLVLEKPVAPDPIIATKLLDNIEATKKSYRIGYTLLNSVWHKRLIWPKLTQDDRQLKITWSFMAHHFENQLDTWKRKHLDGGGILRFYGIHLLALLSHHGYEDVCDFTLEGADVGEPEKLSAVFKGPNLPKCCVIIDSRSSKRCFDISIDGARKQVSILTLKDPFSLESQRDKTDIRIDALGHLLASFEQNDDIYRIKYKKINALWRKIESV